MATQGLVRKLFTFLGVDAAAPPPIKPRADKADAEPGPARLSQRQRRRLVAAFRDDLSLVDRLTGMDSAAGSRNSPRRFHVRSSGSSQMCFEKSHTPATVGLEVTAVEPSIPRVHKNEVLLR